MSKPKWHNGPPPSLGWWPASVCRDRNCLRWWDGKRWSLAAFPDYTARRAASRASYPWGDDHKIQWAGRPANWPARSKT